MGSIQSRGVLLAILLTLTTVLAFVQCDRERQQEYRQHRQDAP